MRRSRSEGALWEACSVAEKLPDEYFTMLRAARGGGSWGSPAERSLAAWGAGGTVAHTGMGTLCCGMLCWDWDHAL